jgi:hypothetical protein
MPINSKKTNFLVALDHFFLMNVPDDMVRGLFSSLNIGTYILPTCGPLCTFSGPFGGAEMSKDSIKKTIIWLFWTISPRTMDLMIWVFLLDF